MAFAPLPAHPMPLAQFPSAGWRWKNFTPGEMACHDGMATILIHAPSLDKLQRLRTALGVPMKVNSAYRTLAYNIAIGGAAGSMHLAARAYDISMDGHDPKEFEVAARKAGFTGFGFYPESNFMHIDTGPAREWGTGFTDDPIARGKPSHGMPIKAASLVKVNGTLKGKNAARRAMETGQDA